MKPTPQKKQTGFNFIELLIAMLLGSLLMLGGFQLFASTNKASKLLQAEAEMQENARFAFSVMTSIIQQAGNYGCKSYQVSPTSSLLNAPDTTFTPWLLVSGWEAKDTQFGDTYTPTINSNVKKLKSKNWLASNAAVKDSGIRSKQHSDIIKIWYSKKQTATISTITNTEITFPPIDLQKGDIITINDCQSITFAQVCSCDDDDSTPCNNNDTKANISPASCNNPGNNAFNASNINRSTAEISILEEAIFFVGKRNDRQSGYQQNTPSLYVKHLGNKAKPSAKEELLEGVESLQALYGEDTNNDQSPNYYVSANQVTNWNNIVSIRISLLLRSRENQIIKNKQVIHFNGAAIEQEATDHYLRRVYTSTIALRNRNLGY